MGCGGYWRPPGPNFSGDPGLPWYKFSPTWPGPIERVQDHQDPGLPKVAGEALGDEFSPKGVMNPHLRGFEGGHKQVMAPIFLRSISFDLEWTDSYVLNILLAYSSVMSSKLTELTESSFSAPPPSVLCGSGVFSKLSSPSMASSGHFDPSQIFDGYRAVEILDPACTECFAKVTGSRQRDVARWTNVGGPIPVGGRPIYSSSEVPISRINTEGVVKRIRRNADSPSDPDAEGSDDLDGEEVEVVPHSVSHPSRNSSAQPLAN
ncbi:hypothetical protein O181_109438 [Austropuccinia psidii MF-1]|uniref:Uncharacterized protein n=1 Tax=Austropuccinia psidii MF-1 TaxID=1389203 RepID=A0A9Q3JUS1_9BASI|nr:hypothetical protein [Austropuccinia psidii MF-1]